MRNSQPSEVTAPAQFEPAQPSTEPAEPTFTLHASNPFEFRAFVQIAQKAEALGRSGGAPALAGILREFEQYEERNRK